MKQNRKWDSSDYADAMKTAIANNCNTKHFRMEGNKIYFNGFWRNGDRQNVCAWLNTATWHDVKTGEGGGCREFAKTAFNMTLPDFMERFADNYKQSLGSTKIDIGQILEEERNNSLDKPIKCNGSNLI